MGRVSNILVFAVAFCFWNITAASNTGDSAEDRSDSAASKEIISSNTGDSAKDRSDSAASKEIISSNTGDSAKDRSDSAASQPQKTSDKGKEILQTFGGDETSEISTNKSMERLPDDILLRIFAYLAFSTLRNVLASANKRFQNLAYLKDLHTKELKLTFDREGTNKKTSLLDPTQAIDYGALKVIEINLKRKANRYEDIFDFANAEHIKFHELEKLKLDVEQISSSDNTLSIISKVLEKTNKLGKFSLHWTSSPPIRTNSPNDIPDMSNNKKKEFWEALRNSKTSDVTFKWNNNYYYHYDHHYDTETFWHHSSSILQLAELRFFANTFECHTAYLQNLTKLTLKIPPSVGSFAFLLITMKESCHTLQEINIDFYYFVHFRKVKDLMKTISECGSLKKLNTHFPLNRVEWNDNLGDSLREPAWRSLVDMLNERKDISFGLKTDIGFFRMYELINIFDYRPPGRNSVPIKSLKLRDQFLNVSRNREVEAILGNCADLEKLHIYLDGNTDNLDSVAYFFRRAKTLQKLKEFSVTYRRSEASVKNILREIINLVEYSSSITKITVKVTSREYLDRCVDIEIIPTHSQSIFSMFSSLSVSKMENVVRKEEEVKKWHDRFVKTHILHNSFIKKMENSLRNRFDIVSKLATKKRKDDSHLLIIEKKKS